MKVRMPTLVASLAAAGLLFTAQADAAKPANPNCWGVVTQQRAVAAGDVGEHAAAQEEPRLGLGNVARAILGEDAHVSELGSALAGLDELDETSCP